MSVVNEVPLPGIGVRYEFVTQSGDWVGVVHHPSGVRELATVLVGGSAGRVVISIGLAALAVVTILTVAARYGPAISRAVFSDSDEALLFGILAVLLLPAGATAALNVSAAVGAFLAGIVFSGPAADRARSLLVPLRSGVRRHLLPLLRV